MFRIDKKIIDCNLLDIIYYEEVFSKSNVLKSTISKGVKTIKSFDLLANEIFNILYKVLVVVNDYQSISPSIVHIKPIIDFLINETIIIKLRNRTVLSLKDTAISLKYILDELIIKLRGSNVSKIIKTEQDKILKLYGSKNKYQEILKLLTENNFNDFDDIVDVFNENIANILMDIVKSKKFSNCSSLMDLLENILINTEKIIDDKDLDNNNYFKTAIDNFYKLKDKNSPIDNLEEYLNYVKDSINKNKVDKENIETNNAENTDVLREAIDYGKTKINNFKKTNYSLVNKNKSDLKPNIEFNDDDFDNIFIEDGLSRKNPIGISIYKDDKKEILENYFKSNKNNRLDEDAYKSLLDFIFNELKNIENEINISKNNIKKQLECLNVNDIFNNSIEKIKEFDENIKILNINKNSIKNLSFDEIINISKFFNSTEMKTFFDKVGKNKELIRKNYSKKKKDKSILSDKILLSDDIDNIIDEELMLFSLDIDAFESDFYDRFLHNRLLTYEKYKPTEKNKGPIILCYDGSGSMEGNKIKETKVYILSFIELARIQKRKLITIQFASSDEPLIIKVINPKSLNINDIYDIMNDFIKGGTDFEKPLKKSIEFIKTDNYKNADILFITDGVCNISDNFKFEFINLKNKMKFKLFSIIMHGNTYCDYRDLGDISDEIMEIKERNLNDWNEKISEKIFSI